MQGVGRFASILVGVLGALVLGGVLDTLLWPGPILALFRPQLTLALALAAVLALATRSRRAALVGGAIAILGAALLLPAVRGPAPEPPAAGAPTVRLLVLNLWRRNDDVAAVAQLIRRERPDAVALIELTSAWERALGPALSQYPLRAAETDEGAAGIGLYGGKVLGNPTLVRLFEDGRASVEAALTLPGGRRASLLLVHPTTGLLPGKLGTHRSSLDAVGTWAAERGRRVAVCGDLNAAPWMRSLRRTLDRGGLRAAFPGGVLDGSWPALPRPLRAPLDGCLVGAGVRAHAELGPGVGSDHLPVLVELG